MVFMDTMDSMLGGLCTEVVARSGQAEASSEHRLELSGSDVEAPLFTKYHRFSPARLLALLVNFYTYKL